MADHPAVLEPRSYSVEVDTTTNNPDSQPEVETGQEAEAQSDSQPEIEPTSNSQLEVDLPSRSGTVTPIDNQAVSPTNHNDVRLPGIREVVGEQLLLPRPPPVELGIPPPGRPGEIPIYLDKLPIQLYEIAGGFYNMTQPPNETKSSHERLTVDHRKIRYTLALVQQPEKARACGSGPRSSADRRPVDPPPVVELRVFANDVDVTMSYDATFMLYASLENSRPIASGKMHSPPTIPVLTGVAVASAAYLERPNPAAYFIFPDLSVRHEGWYRLKFSLFEGVKHEADADEDKPFHNIPLTQDKYTRPVRHESMFNRLEVQSLPFQVFSAKKFPGLNKSTTLSRMVAEQGCRVRIRRDIRQRKRTGKGDVDVDDVHSSYQGTPQATYRTLDHSRSASRNSIGSQYEPDARRLSVDSSYRHPGIQTRQPSIVGMPLGSPSQPTPSQMTISMPPPSAAWSQGTMPRPLSDASPLISPHTPTRMPAPMTFPQSSSLPVEPSRPIINNSGITLPPLFTSSSYHRPLYAVQESFPTKRSASSYTYETETALKDRGRPDNRPPASLRRAYWNPDTSVDGANQVIEPDNGEEEEFEEVSLLNGPLVYERADGSRQNKTWHGHF
ncbi:hypothetical protein LTR84_012203 [Exophiala bonariae]|uniref:Velvet domain-containing protein n=1 Tax=Exophiala bonariae TaxID=1690606 RepID=A0AAV9NFW9_9EURO|nr:hypothetical protein LTR84_012203 [Exophiala bonariae]